MGDSDEHDPAHERMEAVLLRAVDALEAAGVPYALMGGLASAAIGRFRHTHDVDVFVPPREARRALDVLRRAGFRTEHTNPEWLFKAYFDEVLVDVIFASKGGVMLDAEMRERRRPIDIGGRAVQVLSAEDMLVIKAMTNAEHVPRHWHDGLGILSAGDLDWEYLLRRARPYASRVASLLLYAISDGIEVPAEPVRQLFEVAMCEVQRPAELEADHRLAARVRQALATDPRVHELHVSVAVGEGEVVVRGQVATAERREAIDRVLHELLGARQVRNEVEVT